MFSGNLDPSWKAWVLPNGIGEGAESTARMAGRITAAPREPEEQGSFPSKQQRDEGIRNGSVSSFKAKEESWWHQPPSHVNSSTTTNGSGALSAR